MQASLKKTHYNNSDKQDKIANENFANHKLDQKSEFLLSFYSLVKESLGEDIYNKWISHLKLHLLEKDEVIFFAPSKFIRDWVNREFFKTLENAASKVANKKVKLSIICEVNTEVSQDSNPTQKAKVVNLSKYDNVFAFQTELNNRHKFENFVSAKYNKLAVSMAKIAAGVDKQIALFDDKIPLFIHGGVGMGKTHLAQAIAWEIQKFDKSKKVVYLSAEKFMYHFVQSIRQNDVMAFKEKMRSIDVLIVDDIQFIAGKDSTQQEFMNCFNALVEENKQVVLVCDRCPGDLEDIDEKLKSRISGGMVVNFKKANFEDRLEILKSKCQELSQEIDEKILSFIAEKINNSIRDLDGALKKLIAQKLILGEEITLESTKAILSDYIKNSTSKAISVEKIQKLVANFYNLKISDLSSKSRAREIARPRQIAMYLSKKHTTDSLPNIGKSFGGKNHATVIHSVKLVEELINNDQKVLADVKSLEEKI